MLFLNNIVPSVVRFGLVGLALTAWSAAPACAQYPSGPRIPLDARGFQVATALQDYHRRAPAASPAQATPAADAAVTRYETRYLTIVGPDGRARVFRLEGDVQVVQPAERVVHFGAR